MQSGTHEVWSRPPKTCDEGLVPPILGFRFGNKFLGILCPISWSKHTYYGIWLYLRNHFQSRNLLHHPFHKMYTMGIKTNPHAVSFRYCCCGCYFTIFHLYLKSSPSHIPKVLNFRPGALERVAPCLYLHFLSHGLEQQGPGSHWWKGRLV